MATASPFQPTPVLESAIRKLRADEALTAAERAAVRERGWELFRADSTDVPQPDVDPSDPGLDEEEADALFEDLVCHEADEREGRPMLSMDEFLHKLRAIA
jgi:hypothetical protein